MNRHSTKDGTECSRQADSTRRKTRRCKILPARHKQRITSINLLEYLGAAAKWRLAD
ncbi:hypothetical protein IG631_10801 [Alternaria alternata]|nr:hypothetical protein IG631_10801 [Alternaria alternata]